MASSGQLVRTIRTIAPLGPPNPQEKILLTDSIILVDGSKIGEMAIVLPDPVIMKSPGEEFTFKRLDAPTNSTVFFEVANGRGKIEGADNYPPRPFDNHETFSGTVTFVTTETDYKIIQQEVDTVGQVTLKAKHKDVPVENTAVRITSIILLTPLNNPEGSLWVEQMPSKFVIHTSVAPQHDILINYLIKN